MNVFMIGATGYIGGHVSRKLLADGHRVAGLARSPEVVDHLRRLGIEPVPGSLEDANVLTAAAQAADGVIQTAFVIKADLSASVRAEAQAIEVLLAAIRGTDKPLISTSGTAVLGDTGAAVFDEETPIAPHALSQRIDNENLVLQAADVHGIVLRPPNVYGHGDGHQTFDKVRNAGRRKTALGRTLKSRP